MGESSPLSTQVGLLGGTLPAQQSAATEQLHQGDHFHTFPVLWPQKGPSSPGEKAPFEALKLSQLPEQGLCKISAGAMGMGKGSRRAAELQAQGIRSEQEGSRAPCTPLGQLLCTKPPENTPRASMTGSWSQLTVPQLVPAQAPHRPRQAKKTSAGKDKPNAWEATWGRSPMVTQSRALREGSRTQVLFACSWFPAHRHTHKPTLYSGFEPKENEGIPDLHPKPH